MGAEGLWKWGQVLCPIAAPSTGSVVSVASSVVAREDTVQHLQSVARVDSLSTAYGRGIRTGWKRETVVTTRVEGAQRSMRTSHRLPLSTT